MTRTEWKKLRRIMKGYVRRAWQEYRESAAGEFVESDYSLALYARYRKRLETAARLLDCKPAQAVEILNIERVGE